MEKKKKSLIDEGKMYMKPYVLFQLYFFLVKKSIFIGLFLFSLTEVICVTVLHICLIAALWQ